MDNAQKLWDEITSGTGEFGILDPEKALGVISAALREARQEERAACAEIARAIDSGRGNESEIARAIEERATESAGHKIESEVMPHKTDDG